MNERMKELVLEATGASAIKGIEEIQPLWAGHGHINRLLLGGGNHSSIIVKEIRTSKSSSHPRGWNTNQSHQRKVKSYDVETAWYQKYNAKNLLDDLSRTPQCIATRNSDGEMLILLEDLDKAGFPKRLEQVSLNEVKLCLKWLANFHAKFLMQKPLDLWKTGSYWHLETRPDEYKKIEGTALHKIAHLIDEKLKSTPFQTIIHGDAKLANFCFSDNSTQVAAVDFQYVGGGCGMKDVAYFIGSCLDEKECEKFEAELLNNYFEELELAISITAPAINFIELERSWRDLYHYAWCDFYRFLKGWSPGHWKINSYSEKISASVIAKLSATKEQQ